MGEEGIEDLLRTVRAFLVLSALSLRPNTSKNILSASSWDDKDDKNYEDD